MRDWRRPAVLVAMVAGFCWTGAAHAQTAEFTPDPAAAAAVAVDRSERPASRSQQRTALPVSVPDDVVWTFDDGGMTQSLAVAFAELEARKAAEAAAAEAARVAAEQEAARVAAQQAAAAARTAPPVGSTPDVGSVKAYASDLVGGGEQWACLEALWQKESGWNHLADNPSSSAYGIPQALPGSKMASAGADWATNPLTQVKWGVGYIEGRYGTACDAWAHSKAKNWY